MSHGWHRKRERPCGWTSQVGHNAEEVTVREDTETRAEA